MIHLHPLPGTYHNCPYCHIRLEVKGWYIPGMRNLADLRCSRCGRDFYGDLPAGHALYYPMLLEQDTGIVHNEHHVEWFAKWLHDSHVNRVDLPINFTIEEFLPVKQPILLNCLDKLYGHCLLKLLNAQYYLDYCPGFDLVVLIPRFLRWMVPDGVAAIWTVDLPLKRGTEWNNWLDAEIKRQIKPFEVCWLSVGLSHPHPEDYNIERFTRVRPFPIDEWDIRLKQPVVTFIWREDRVWGESYRHGLRQALTQQIKLRFGIQPQLNEQKRQVVALAESLRRAFPQIDFAVAGLGNTGGLPDWINDLRTLNITENIEKKWCEQYARSHIVIGVHGSNMLLPSAHAGAVVELVPTERWGNLIQDILLTPREVRETIFRHKFLPVHTSATIIAEVIISLLRWLPNTLLNFNRPWCDHKAVQNDPQLIIRRRQEIAKRLADYEISHP